MLVQFNFHRYGHTWYADFGAGDVELKQRDRYDFDDYIVFTDDTVAQVYRMDSAWWIDDGDIP